MGCRAVWDEVVEIVAACCRRLCTNGLHRLFISAEPGTACIGLQREFCGPWAYQREGAVSGYHFSWAKGPAEIGLAIVESLASLQ